MQLKKLKKRLTKAQQVHRDKKLYDRKHSYQTTQDKDVLRVRADQSFKDYLGLRK